MAMQCDSLTLRVCVCVYVCGWVASNCVSQYETDNIFHIATTNCNNSSKLSQHLFGKGQDIGPIHEVIAMITCHKKIE